MSRLSGKDLRFLALEGVMVLFGVLSALLVDEWREDRALQKEADAATAQLLAEVRQNLAELETVGATVSERVERLAALEDVLDGTVPLGAVTGRFGGYRTADLSEGAWIRLSTGSVASQVPQDLLQDAFALYAVHRYFVNLDDEVTRLVFSELNVDPARARFGWRIAQGLMGQQLEWVRLAIPRYRDFLARWDPSWESADEHTRGEGAGGAPEPPPERGGAATASAPVAG